MVDDEAAIRDVVSRVAATRGYRVETAEDGARGIEALRRGEVDVVFTDLRMPGADGIAVLEESRKLRPEADVVVMTAFGTIESAVEAMKLGAKDFILKPFSLDLLDVLFRRLDADRRLRDENARLSRLAESGEAAAEIVGNSAAIAKVLDLIRSVAPSDSTVLVTGESGTGKELVARAVHRISPRGSSRFVPINCAALNPSLLESEIFGHEQGAFTGAVKRKIGLIEAGQGGTLFLDEVGETEPAFQAKLLRVLQEREFFRVGGTDPIPADVRVVAATNRDLKAEIGKGRFREDLFYRLNVFPIPVPPLRERLEDVAPLTEHLLTGLARKLGRPRLRASPEAMEVLRRYAWPGNVRELQNAIERAALLCGGETIGPEHLPAELAARPPSPPPSDLPPLGDLPPREARERLDRSYVRELLRALHGNVSEAARRAGLGRSAFHEMLGRLEIDPTEFRQKGGHPAGGS